MSFLDLFKIQQGFNAFDLHVQKIHVFTDHVPEVEQNKQWEKKWQLNPPTSSKG